MILKSIKVLCVISKLGLGGQEKNFVELVSWLDRTQIEPLVLVFEPGGIREKTLRESNIPVVVFKITLGYRIIRLFKIFIACRKFKPHIIQAFDPVAGIYSCIAGRLARVPFIISGFHASYLPLRVQFSYRCLWPLIDKVVCNSKSGLRYMIKKCHIPPKRIIVIHPGLDFRRMESESSEFLPLRTKLRLNQGQILVGMVGKLNKDKDPLIFARAAVVVHKLYPEVAFCIIGSGPYRSMVQSFLTQQKLLNCFFLIPECQEAPLLIRDFEIGVLCSRTEGSPSVILEYMYWAKPCVVTDVGDCRELVEHGKTGMVVSAGNPSVFALALLELLREPKKAQQMGIAGRKQLEAHYQIEGRVADFLNLFQTTLNNG